MKQVSHISYDMWKQSWFNISEIRYYNWYLYTIERKDKNLYIKKTKVTLTPEISLSKPKTIHKVKGELLKAEGLSFNKDWELIIAVDNDDTGLELKNLGVK